MKPLLPTNRKLRQACALVLPSQLRTKAVQGEIDQLLDFVYGSNNKGSARDRTRPMTVGLSANQVGLMKQISVVDLAIGNKSHHDIHVLINPSITWHSKAVDEKSEGCVNLKTVWGIVPRYREVEVQALDRSGNRITIRAKGWAARLLQHEIDHLNGRLFIDRLPDPTKAHKVEATQLSDYNKRDQRASWPYFTDVTTLIK